MVKSAAPEHSLSTSLSALSAEAGFAGLALGRDTDGGPVQVLLFRPEPTHVTLIGDLRTAQIIVLRCLGAGARVVIRAAGGLADAPHWTMLDQAAAGSGRRVWHDESVITQDSSRTLMMLYVYDSGSNGPLARQALGSWQTQLTVISQVNPSCTPTIAASDLVLTQRLSLEEAHLAAAALGHGEEVAAGMATMPDDMVAAMSRSAVRWTWLMPTSVEQRLFS